MKSLINTRTDERKLETDLYEIVDMISEAVDLSEKGVGRHGKRVAVIAKRIYEELFKEPMPNDLIIAAILHDIGAQDFKLRANLGRLFPEENNLERHSADGEMLLNGVDVFKGIAPLIRNHHTAYRIVQKRLNGRDSLYANIINLADRVDITIGRTENILLQTGKVVDRISRFPEGFFAPECLQALKNISHNLSFWLDINNEEQLDRILKGNITEKRRLSYGDLSQIADLCAKMIDRKSPYTARHSFSVAQASSKLAHTLGLDEEHCFFISLAGKFHDVGKLCIPEGILEKPAALDPYEKSIIQQHAYYSYYILSKVSEFDDIKKWAAFHHENLDGTGYPFSLKGEEIPLESRIIAVADKAVALTEERPYRGRIQKEDAIKILTKTAEDNWSDRRVLDRLVDNYDYIMQGL